MQMVSAKISKNKKMVEKIPPLQAYARLGVNLPIDVKNSVILLSSAICG
jgi:hypothetical protein